MYIFELQEEFHTIFSQARFKVVSGNWGGGKYPH